MKKIQNSILCLALLCGAAVFTAQTPEWQWAVGAGGPETAINMSDTGKSIATDSQGNQYVTGYFSGTATFGSQTLTASGAQDLFVAKLNPSGNWLWAVCAGGTEYDSGLGIAVDGAGNAYVTGCFEGTATFGSHSLTTNGYYDIFVAKLDVSGNWLWAVQAGGSSEDRGNGISVDGTGNTYVTGTFYGTATFGTRSIISSGNQDIFVAKLDPNGNWLWVVQAGGSSEDRGNGISVDGAGNTYVTGTFYGTATFSTHSITSSGNQDIFVAKLDHSGTWLWVIQAGGIYGDSVYGIAMDDVGNAYVIGDFCSTAYFGTLPLTASGEDDIFAAKVSPDGNIIWAVKAGGTNSDAGHGIAVDGVGNAYVTGSFRGTATFGNHVLTVSGDEWFKDIFAAKLDPSGNWLWAVRAGGTSEDMGYGIDVDGAGNAYVTGHFQYQSTFGSHTLAANGGYDIFVAKFSPLTPDAHFSADVLFGSEPLTVQFSDHSIPGQYPIMNWLWTFGDGDSSTQQNPLHTYTTPGIYTVSLTVIDQNYQTSTKVRPNYITVIERSYSVELISPESLSFSSVYLEEQSGWQEVTFSNTGNVDLNFSEAHFLAEPLHFELSEGFAGFVLPPGESGTLLVRFAPQAVGALSDTLFIVNNSTNLPVIKVKLNGTGLYVPPKTPENVLITMDGDNAVITWNAVTQNIHDQPITPDYYFIFNSSDPFGDFGYHGSVSGLQYIHPMVGAFQTRMFYRVVTYKYYGRGSFDLAALGLEPGMTEAEITRRLKLATE
ncbi:MAG: SBBP repeat-containing protein [Candidatus Cloacimonetes bacterium]|nr:SBBP repeat-containing protein [Candidatus Cloacimonadota bacterium]